MVHTKLITKLTEADLPLQAIELSFLDQLKSKPHTYVHTMDLKSSSQLLISENFARCQGISFFSPKKTIGALAHHYPAFDPYNTLTGKWTGGEHHLEDPKAVFDDLSQITAVHTYHIENHRWPEQWIEGALATLGITKVIHIPIKSRMQGGAEWRHVAQDVKEGSLYIFPTDFDFGIKYKALE
jgi:hypothetical protein